VFDLHSDIDVLVQWGTVDYFEARGTAWMFRCSLEVPPLSASLEVPPQSAEDGDFLQMTSEAFHAAAGPKDMWSRGIAFLAVHCEIQELMSADPAHAVRIPGPVVAPWHIPWYIPDFWYILLYAVVRLFYTMVYTALTCPCPTVYTSFLGIWHGMYQFKVVHTRVKV
jgi:hypothetical protein